MKKGIVCLILATYALALTGCNVGEMSSLRDISRPYVGEYKCKKLQLGGEEMLKNYEYVNLELTYDGAFELRYLATDGNENAYDGTYKLSEENKAITLSAQAEGKEMSYVFPYEKGKVIFQLTMGEKLLYAEFAMVE